MNITVIGMGMMGGPMALNLLAAGHAVVVHNRTREREGAFVEAGCGRAGTPREAVAGAEVVVICVSDTPDVEQVLFEPERGAAEGLERGSLVIDCSTICPEATGRFAGVLGRRGVGYVDAPVSGGPEGARNGTLGIMCGGSPEDMERARALLEILGGHVTHVGPVGSGQVAKAVNQIVIAGTYQALAEGIAFAARLGVDPGRVVEAIRHGAARSWILENRGQNMIEDRYPQGFRMSLHRKDLGIALAAAREAGVTMPVASYVAAAEDGLIGRGFGDEDMSALARLVRESSGLPPGSLGGATDAG